MSYRTIERDGRQHLVFTTGGEVRELQAKIRELRRQLHEARQEAQGIRDQRDAKGEGVSDA